MAKGDYKKQYERVIEGLTIQLKAALLDQEIDLVAITEA